MRYKKEMSKYEHLEGWERCSLGKQLEHWASKYTHKIALVDSEENITYEELNQRVEQMASAFICKGIEPGDRVVVQLPNRISFVEVLFALMKAGAVPILMLPAHREAELEGIVKLAEPTAYIVAEQYLGYRYVDMALAIKEKFSCLKNVFVDGNGGQGLQSLSGLQYGNVRFPEVDGYQTAVLLLSGGTTGVPKLIPRTHTDYMYNARMSAKRCQLDENSVYLAALPVAHNFPLCCPGLLGTLDAGGKVVLAPTTSPDDILMAITEEEVTITALVPAMVTVCMEMLEYDEDFDISSLKILQVGGAMLEDSLADKIIEKWPCTLMQVFGTAEGLLSFTSLDDDTDVIARCQGTPVSPADEVKIVDENDEEVQRGVYGELLSRGPYTIDGYYMAEEANRTSFTEDGFYRTGDKAMWTESRCLRMGGRIKEQINRAGEKIMPAEIEAYLCKHLGIKEAAVVGVPDETLGNRICAFIMTDEGSMLDVSSVHQFLKGIGVASYKLPDQVEIIEEWPLTSVGKIDKKLLGQMAQEK
ncbi:(2,3-dihydroxybenzoyl)adenylate synthase [Sporosarcina sp.]|uniref:(2,3-dihydroxybenzoyl)adenylate synthase n=1 Tax=Sporosarcina sp. TaxID=49982 RepID=UPI00260E3768|nr:AMP-binding protein [Sporosarcina sp.]